MEETLGALNELVEAGKVRFIGCSNFSPAQVEAADAIAARRGIARFVSAQNEYSWLERQAEEELVPVCERLGIGLIPYFPLANGLLTGKYHRGEPEPAGTRLSGRLNLSEERWDRIEALEAFASECGVGLLEVAIGGLAAQPAVCSVIAGAMSPEQVRANAAAGAWEPTGRRARAAARAVRDQWQAMAPRWEQGRELLWRGTRPVSEWLVARLDPRPGETIVELAAGTRRDRAAGGAAARAGRQADHERPRARDGRGGEAARRRARDHERRVSRPRRRRGSSFPLRASTACSTASATSSRANRRRR